MGFKEQIDINRLPEHVAIIMDGNGRWAKNQGKFRVFGHESGVLSVKDIMEYFLAGGSTPGGSAFNAYLKIMNAYDGINDAVKSRVTYESKVT